MFYFDITNGNGISSRGHNKGAELKLPEKADILYFGATKNYNLNQRIWMKTITDQDRVIIIPR